MGKKSKDRKKVSIGYRVSITIYFIIGILCGILMASYMDKMHAATNDAGEYFMYLAVTLVGLYASIFIHIILHEGGHLVFGLMTGYKFSSFRIGNYMWIKKDDRVVLRRFSLAGTGGQCLMVPPDMKGDSSRYPFVWYNLGGCISNVVFALLALLLSFGCKEIGILSLILGVFAVVGFALAIMNGIPLKAGTVDNDGSNVIAISRSEKARKAFWLMMKINEQTARGVRIKDMPKEWFVMPEDSDMDNVMVSSTAVFICNRLMDELRLEEAYKLETMLVNNEDIKLSGIYRSLLINDMIYCELVGENRQERIEELLNKEQKKFMKAMKKFPSVLRTGYAYMLIYKKDNEEAARILELFNKMGDSYPNKADIDSERELLDAADVAADKKRV